MTYAIIYAVRSMPEMIFTMRRSTAPDKDEGTGKAKAWVGAVGREEAKAWAGAKAGAGAAKAWAEAKAEAKAWAEAKVWDMSAPMAVKENGNAGKERSSSVFV